MAREPLDLFRQTVRESRFDPLYDPRMQSTSPLAKQTAVDDLVGERVLEGVFEIGEQRCLVQELGGLEAGQALAQLALGQLCDGLEQRVGDVLADHGRALEQAL